MGGWGEGFTELSTLAPHPGNTLPVPSHAHSQSPFLALSFSDTRLGPTGDFALGSPCPECTFLDLKFQMQIPTEATCPCGVRAGPERARVCLKVGWGRGEVEVFIEEGLLRTDRNSPQR